jgi:hypothetical protein
LSPSELNTAIRGTYASKKSSSDTSSIEFAAVHFNGLAGGLGLAHGLLKFPRSFCAQRLGLVLGVVHD